MIDDRKVSPERQDAEVSLPWPDSGPAAVVIAGAGARGAYEAGVLAELLPALFKKNGLRDAVLLGTSAGAVNAALWAQYATAGTPLKAVGDKVCAFWTELSVEKVFRPVAQSVLSGLFQLKIFHGGVTGILDSTPLFAHAKSTLRRAAIAQNIANGSLGGLGVVATTCPLDGTGGRSRLFLQMGEQFRVPSSDPTSALDFIKAELTHEHVLASAAIPGLFPAVHIAGDGYYCDGGVRLNTPIAPALNIGARRLVIASSHATEYPKAVAIDEQPDVVDLAAQAIHVVLADGMIEDLRTLKRINGVVRQAKAKDQTVTDPFENPPRPYEDIPFVAVAPKPGQLAQLARQVFRDYRGLRLNEYYRRFEYMLFEDGIRGFGQGAGNDELLSYLLFDRTYAAKQIELGREDARNAIATQPTTQPSAPKRFALNAE